jgi:ketosteroid isomerase-like protein
VERNNPVVVAEVTACHEEYERALVAGDLEAMKNFFDDTEDVVRYGIADRQRGSEELAEFRATRGGVLPGRTLTETTVWTFGQDTAVVGTLFSYPGRSMLGRQSQTWVRLAGKWRIVHAHVSEIPG